MLFYISNILFIFSVIKSLPIERSKYFFGHSENVHFHFRTSKTEFKNAF